MRVSPTAEAGKNTFIWVVLLFAFFPLYIMLTISLKNNSQFIGNPWTPESPFHVSNWAIAWDIVKHYIFNTIFVAVTATTVTFCFTLPAAYFFARYKMPGSCQRISTRLCWWAA